MSNEETGHVHDWSHVKAAQDAQNEATVSPGRAELFKSFGLAGFGIGAGIGFACYGASFVIVPKIIETTKVVVETRVERVEIPKPIITEKIVQVPAAPLPHVPAVGQKATEEQFTQSAEYSSAAFSGLVSSFVEGEIKFSNGRSMLVVDGTGGDKIDKAKTTTAFDGDYAYCGETRLRFDNGTIRWDCRVLHNGKVLSLFAGKE